jgi:hypothetical protein
MQVQKAVETRTVDSHQLSKIVVARIICTLASRAASALSSVLQRHLKLRVSKHYAARTFELFSRLDVPTAMDAVVRSQLQGIKPNPHMGNGFAPMNALLGTARLLSTSLDMLSRVAVLVVVLREQQDGLLLAFITGLRYFFSMTRRNLSDYRSGEPWFKLKLLSLTSIDLIYSA